MSYTKTVKGPLEKVLVTIEKGEKEEILREVNALYEDSLKIHDRLVGYVNLLLGFIAREMGEGRVRDAWRYVIERVHKKGLVSLKGKPFQEVVDVLFEEHLVHGSDLSLEEEEGKTTIVLHCCGSGGRLRKGNPPGSEEKIREPRSWAFDREGISYYCTHCSIVTQDSPDWDAGFTIRVEYGDQFDEKGDPVDRPCRFEIIREKSDG